MNEQEFKNKTGQRWDRNRWSEHREQGRQWVGVLLVVVGGLFLARASGADIPGWLFSWPMLLIGVGLFSGIRHGFRGFGWLIPIVIGGIFLVERFSPDPEVKRYLWPTAIIAVGLLFIFRPKKKRWFEDENEAMSGTTPERVDSAGANVEAHVYPAEKKTCGTAVFNDRGDTIDATAIFGGVKRNILSKNFRGGDVTTFMGGAEIDMTRADCNGRVVIDCFNMFGGTKLIIPPDWDVQSDMVSIFGGIEDKRQPTQVNPTKVLFLDGTCIFGGVEIKSY